MSRVFDGSDSYLTKSAEDLGISSHPCTIFTYFKATSLPDFAYLFQYNNDTVGGYYLRGLVGDTNNLRAASNQSASRTASTATITHSGTTWYPVVFIYNATISSRVVGYGADENHGSTSTYQTNNTPNVFIGDREAGSAFALFGKMAHFTVWDVQLSEANIAALIAGANPALVDSVNQTRYWSFTDTSLTDSISSSVLTSFGTTTDSDNPIIAQTGDVNAVIAADSTIVYEQTGGGGSSIPIIASSIYSRMRQG